jgi:starch synthase
VLAACRQHPDKLRFISEWDADFPKQLFAAADVFLMPSHFEPCGLAPLHAMRFGAVPVAHAAGGVLENLTDFDPSRGSGNALLYFTDSRDSLWDTLLRAIALFSDKAAWQVPLQNAMRSSYPWDRSAASLDALYKRLIPV